MTDEETLSSEKDPSKACLFFERGSQQVLFTIGVSEGLSLSDLCSSIPA